MTTVRISNAKLFADAATCVSKEETRYYLQGVYIHKNEVKGGINMVSTDGHRLIVVHDPLGNIDGDPVIVKANKAFLASIKKNMKYLDAEIEVRGKEAILSNIDNSGMRSECGRDYDVIIDGTFPDYLRVIPSFDPTKPIATGSFNAGYIESFGTLSGNKSQGVTMFGNDATQPFLVFVNDRADLFGVLMPMRHFNEASLPEWFKAVEKK